MCISSLTCVCVCVVVCVREHIRRVWELAVHWPVTSVWLTCFVLLCAGAWAWSSSLCLLLLCSKTVLWEPCSCILWSVGSVSRSRATLPPLPISLWRGIPTPPPSSCLRLGGHRVERWACFTFVSFRVGMEILFVWFVAAFLCILFHYCHGDFSV